MMAIVSTLFYILSSLSWLTLTSSSGLIPGPGTFSYNDGNETITFDFSDIEFYPVESFPLFTSTKLTSSEGLKVPATSWEKKIIARLINAVDFDQVNATKEGRLLSASDLPQMLSSPNPSHPMGQGTPDYLKCYGVSSLGPSNLFQKKLTTLAIEGDFAPDNVRHYSVVRLQNNFNFGRKIVRLAFWHSMNEENPRHIWLTDARMWRGTSLTPLGRVLAPGGWAIMWTY
ncbi:hypothetical protein HDE_10805 [Halotydeus destructor]|nr:hypothetical protein HDE_10805 [Halotydeus destructor]